MSDCVMLSGTTITKDELFRQFSTGSVAELSIDQMAIVIEAYKKALAEKGIIFNCYVFKKSSMDDTSTEFVSFLKTLEANKKNYPDNTRIQYVFLNSDLHWTTADILISNNSLSFFLLEAANLENGLKAQIDLIERNCSENTVIMVSALDIQNDGKNCGFFSLRLAKNLSEITFLHQMLKKTKNPAHYHPTLISEWISKNTSETDVNPVKYISRDLLLQLNGFGSLFKNTQKIFNTKDATCKNNKLLDLVLKEYRIEFEKKENGITTITLRNPRIYHKRKDMVEDCKTLLLSLSEEECQEILNKKNGQTFLEELKNKKNNQEIVTLHMEVSIPRIDSFSRNNNVHFYPRHVKVQPPLQEDKPSYTIYRTYF